MKRISFFALASTLVLVLAGVFATKAAKRFVLVTKAIYFTGGTNIHTAFAGASADILITNTSSNAGPAQIISSAGTFTLYTASGSAELFLPTTL